MSLGLFQPEFTDADNYEDFYGSAGVGTSLMIEHFPWEYAVTLGYSFHVGFFQDSGNAQLNSGGTLSNDSSTELDFTILPVQASLNLIATPFPESKWFTLSGWFGFERTMFSETRRSTSDTSSSEDSSDSKSYSNFGFRNATIVGASFNILIKGKGADSSMDVLGLRRIFLSPYFEIVESAKDDGFQLGGRRLGLYFSFELDDG